MAILISALMFDPGGTRAEDCVHLGDWMHGVGSVDTPGGALAVAVEGPFAYVADLTFGLQVIDISDPLAPAIVGNVLGSGVTQGVAVAGSLVYFLDANAGLQVVDVSDPRAPAIVGWVDTPDSPVNVALNGSFAYVADGTTGLLVIDVSNPRAPVIVGAVTTVLAADVDVVGSYAYVADGVAGLQVIDVSNPRLPMVVGNADTPSNASGVDVVGSYAYVADGEAGLQVIAVSNPLAPVIVGSFDTQGNVGDLVVAGSIAYIADAQLGLRTIDVSNPSAPVLLGGIFGSTRSFAVDVEGSHAYVAGGPSGLQVIDISNPSTPGFVGGVATPGVSTDVAAAEAFAYVADGEAGLHVIDISSPDAPRILGTADTPGSAYGVAVAEPFAYVADVRSLQVIDISNPSSPTIVGGIDTPGPAVDVAVLGSYAYVADFNTGVQVIDISNPASPAIAGVFQTPGHAYGIAVQGSFAYLVDLTSLRVLDISNPLSPVFLGFVPMRFAQGVCVAGTTAFVADWDNGMHVVDVSNPRTPAIVGSILTGFAKAVAVAGSYVYVGDGQSGYRAVDISNPTAPAIVSGVDTGDVVGGIAAAGSFVYIAAGPEGLRIAAAPCHAAVGFSTPRLQLPVVTLGDAVTSTFDIVNAGNDTLEVLGIDVPRPDEMHIDATPPFVLAPASSREIQVSFTPTAASNDTGWMLFDSNDPANLRERLLLAWDARRIPARSRLLAASDTLPLGQAVTVEVLTDPLVRVERAWLFYRSDSMQSFVQKGLTLVDSLPLPTWIGVIPSEAVVEGGLEHYVELSNGEFVTTDPPDGAAAPFHNEVEPPLRIDAAARPTVGIEERAIEIVVELPVGARFVAGQLQYRKGGERDYALVPLSLTGQRVALGTIPAEAVGTRGLEYWVAVQTRDALLSDPPRTPRELPASIRVSATSLDDPAHAGGRYRLLGMPLVFPENSTLDLQDVLSGQSDFGPYDPMRWRAFRYDPQLQQNVEYSAEQTASFRPQPGRAVWLISRQEHRVDTAPAGGLSVPTRAPYAFAVHQGWNLISNPFAFPVAWSAIRAELERRSSPLAAEQPVAFDPARGSIGDYAPAPPAVLEPFEGYFLYNPSTAPESLWVPALEAQTLELARALHRAPASPQDAWLLRIEARTQEATDGSNVLGVLPEADDARDAFDQREPPPPPGPWTRLEFVQDGVRLRHDVRAPDPEGHAWEMEIRTSGRGEEVVLDTSSQTVLPDELSIRLVDSESQESIVLRPPGGRIALHRILSRGADGPYRMVLLAGSESYVARQVERLAAIPGRTLLDQNTPNPFNATTHIRFGLAAPERVSLTIYNVRGELVTTLVHAEPMPAGYHSVLWGGTEADGRTAASGLYLCRLTAGATVLTRRLLLLK